MEKISVVIPMYRSENTITSVVEELISVLEKMNGYRWEIILVNDCGPDNVLDVAKTIAKQCSKIKIIELMKNSGQENAMAAGYAHSQGDYIVSMDDDMQHPAKEIPQMLHVLKEQDLDVVLAAFPKPKRSLFRRIGSKINEVMSQVIIGKPKNVQTNSFFIMRRVVLDSILSYGHDRPYIYGLIFAVTHRVANVEIEHRERLNGKSNYNLIKLFHIWLNGFISFSNKPARMVSIVGFLVATVAAGIAVLLIVIALVNQKLEVRGWTSTILFIVFFAGVQLVSIGIIGEYIGRMYLTQSSMPHYVVRNVIKYQDAHEESVENEDKLMRTKKVGSNNEVGKTGTYFRPNKM